MLFLQVSLLMTFAGLSTAFAQGAPGGPGGSPPMFMQLIPFVFMMVVLYFLMIRPQAKKQKSHMEFLQKLKRGDEVVTSSGILGTVEGLTDTFITLEIAPNVRIKVLRSQVATSATQAHENASGVKTT